MVVFQESFVKDNAYREQGRCSLRQLLQCPKQPHPDGCSRYREKHDGPKEVFEQC